MHRFVVAAAVVCVGCVSRTAWAGGAGDASVRALAEEVRDKGRIVFCARSQAGDWDLFLCRPDGSELRNLTRTAEFNESAPQFSRDGRALLYRRLPRSENIDGNRYGAQGQLVLADSDGSNAQVLGAGGEHPWASWSPDGAQMACLSIQGISIVDLAGRQTGRTLERKGFFQQLTWSPDGQSFIGVANSFGTGWSVARMDATTGQVNAVSRVDCCTPDWFPDSRDVIFSNRPSGQKGNSGYGWTQLWRADAEGRERKLVYGEDGRHIYGGCVSPDGKYVLFTGNMREDGDPGNAGAPMGLIRLSDAPIITGESKDLRALHPGAGSGPVLALPSGWEPCWTLAQCGEGVPPLRREAILTSPHQSQTRAANQEREQEQGQDALATKDLASEVRGKGWIVFSAANDSGDWDLFLMRPDGSDRRRLTDTREFNEAGAKFSRDGSKLLYYRMPASTKVDNNTYGLFELIVADSDGGDPVSYGSGMPWASWGPDGRQIACLDKKGIRIVDLASRQVMRQFPRSGIVQQLAWSPDGRRFTGTANGLGVAWTVGCLDAEAGPILAVSETDRYNCTPDWLPDSEHIIYSRGIVPGKSGWAQLWIARADGSRRQLLYAEPKRHMYGGCVSPDGNYVLFTRSEVDLGQVDNSRTRMAIIRRKDAPMVGGDDASLKREFPDARRGLVLDLSWGWEPDWRPFD
jgi:Tol biopolymer transport system component